MVLEILFVAVLPSILIASAMWDLTSFTIPNVFPAALVVLFLVFVGAAGFTAHPLGLADIGLHAASFGIGLVGGLAFFALGWVGGGDAKLFAAACLWLGWDALFHYALYSALFGGVLTLGVLLLRRVPLPSGLLGEKWLVRLTDQRSGIPYGAALASAAIALLPSNELFHLAASS